MLTNSVLGFGLMRLPRNNQNEIDLAQVSKMVDEYLAKGFTYFDTAYVYGGSEVATKACLTSRHARNEYTIASKLPAWEIHKEEDMQAIFNETLNRLGVDYLDFYLLHAIGTANLPDYNKYDAWGFLRKLKAEGKIKHMGFSFHDKPALLDQLLTEHPEVEFVQLQINYLDWDSLDVCSRELLEVANKHSVPVIVMEPVKGGQLAALPPKEAERYHKDYPNSSQAALALRFVSSQPGIMTVLSGMSNEEQMRDNLKTYTDFKPFTQNDYDLVKEIVDGIHSYERIPCTSCHYCMDGCPKNIRIPNLFQVKNHYTMYKDKQDALRRYAEWTKETSASTCIKCGKCEKVCPQHINIRDLLSKISEDFGY